MTNAERLDAILALVTEAEKKLDDDDYDRQDILEELIDGIRWAADKPAAEGRASQ